MKQDQRKCNFEANCLNLNAYLFESTTKTMTMFNDNECLSLTKQIAKKKFFIWYVWGRITVYGATANKYYWWVDHGGRKKIEMKSIAFT